VIVSWVGIKIACFDNQSTITRMAVKPSEDGNCLMKSMEIEFQGFSRIGSCQRWHMQIQRGASSTRLDDTKSLKGMVLDWIILWGQPLNPPLARNVKTNHGYHHELTGVLLCAAGLDWSDME